jgi:branched-chain amino acid aminotransferase
MLVCDYANGQWGQPQILPLANLSLHPATLALHYGQTVFEGMKAFYMEDGRLNIFRIDKHYERFCLSLERMCMPAPPEEIFREGLIRLVETDKAWAPKQAGAALYLRPFMYASEPKLGVKISEQYRFVIIAGPVPELYTRPIRVKVETNYIRAARGGTGFAKCGGNYGAAFLPTKMARAEGYDQVLWTDAAENKFIEESGTMNVMFVVNGKLVTAPLSDSILDGVTRDSLLRIAQDKGIPVEERPVAVEELTLGFLNNAITEIFGAGTAAVVAPICLVGINGLDYTLPAYEKNSIQQILKKEVEEIRSKPGRDPYGWNLVV